MQGKELAQELTDYLTDVAAGSPGSISSGFSELDFLVGKMRGGQLWAIGGYPGMGKSYYLANMIDRLVSAGVPCVVITTELSERDYVVRHVCMRVGVWKTAVERTPEELNTVADATAEFKVEVLNRNLLTVYYEIDYSTAEKKLTDLQPGTVVFIDYIQPMVLKGVMEENAKVTEISRRLKALAVKLDIPVVVASQITNNSLKDDLQKSVLVPFDYGKELNRAAHVSLVLLREKEQDQLAPILQVRVVKAREGSLGKINYKVLPGYKLEYLDLLQSKRIYDDWKSSIRTYS